MKFRAPMYFNDFHCIADKCKDSCCSAGWEIDIDSEAKNYYINVPGEFGEKLRANISKKSPCHIILDKNKKCPFLNDKKLCDIYINLGEKHLCEICKEHPRFYEWFDEVGVKEAGIGLCCEEVARIILSETRPFSICERESVDEIYRKNPYETNPEYNKQLFNYLENSRKKIIDYLDNSNTSIEQKLRNILWFGYTTQQNIDNNLLDDEEIFDVNSNSNSRIHPLVDYFSTLEPNDRKWPVFLKMYIRFNSNYYDRLECFEASNPEIDNYLKNISIYFTWRYFLKSFFDGDVLSEVKLMYVSVHIIKFLLFCKWQECDSLSFEECIDVVKKYSEEVEYCEDNLIQFAEDSYRMEIFDIEYLLGL